MKNLAISFVALVLMVLIGIPVWIIQHIRYPLIGLSVSRLWWNTAIGLDQLGGAILYGEPDWTISSRTYFLAKNGNKYAKWFEAVIDFIFGEGHCRHSYYHEFGGEAK